MCLIVSFEGEVVGCEADVVHSPERDQAGGERSSDKVIVTVSIGGVGLGRIVHARMFLVIRGIFLLSERIQI